MGAPLGKGTEIGKGNKYKDSRKLRTLDDEKSVSKRGSCSAKHDPNKKNKGESRGRPSVPTRTPRYDSVGGGKKKVQKNKYKSLFIGIDARVRISGHLKVVSLETRVLTRTNRLVMVRKMWSHCEKSRILKTTCCHSRIPRSRTRDLS